MQKGIHKFPNAKEVEKEISEFLSKRFGDRVKLAAPIVIPEAEREDDENGVMENARPIAFDMKPEELIAYLDQYIIRQEAAKAVLSTKICTHFNRIRRASEDAAASDTLVGAIKNNILMIGPTGVGKTYMIKLIAQRLGVPFVKGDATKFSETGYVGGDVEDLVRDLVREAGDDIERAQHGIIYIDEIDKIAGAQNLIGADVSRSGVQRALLKPMEETEVELKVAHDPVSMLQEIDRFRRTGDRNRRVINTRHILFIMSGAFSGLQEIIEKRLSKQAIGFNAALRQPSSAARLLQMVKTEDLITFGFESEFVGRLPVRTVFEELDHSDLFSILKNPNNPIILGKKRDFSAYGIDVKFTDDALRQLAVAAAAESTGARGLVSAVENALLDFERRLPSSTVKRLPVTTDTLCADWNSRQIQDLVDSGEWDRRFEALCLEEKRAISDYLRANALTLGTACGLTLTDAKCEMASEYASRHVVDVTQALHRIKTLYGDVSALALTFLEKNDINIVLEEDAADLIVTRHIIHGDALDAVYGQLTDSFAHGLKLVMQRTGRRQFFISREALEAPEAYVRQMIKSGTEESASPVVSLSFSSPEADGA
ncbi:MAG: AAA family ATPase [Pseudomonadota bacterium]